jgi:hypothetical protein
MSGPSRKSRGTPVIFGTAGARPVLEQIKLGAGQYDEAWLQQLIFDHPALLPVVDIEPGFGELVAVAREVPCGHGYIDNLYITRAGEIVLVETKLWRNVQARREVVAQALDYVAALMGLGYSAFEAAALKGACGPTKPKSLYGLIADHHDAPSEPEFIDAVAANLARGRMLVIALGDGIRQEAEALARLLQGHAGAHFTFALVELATWRNIDSGELLVVPNTLAQTVMIERGIVIVDNGKALIQPMPPEAAVKAQSLTEAMFYETLAKKDPALPPAIRAFLASVEPLGVYPDLKASLNLKVDLADAPKPINLGYIDKQGRLWTDPLAARVPEHLALRYNQTLADLIGGKIATQGEIHVTTNGSSGPMVSALLPQHSDAWAEAVRLLLSDLAADQQARAA